MASNSSLKSLRKALIDARKGYETASSNAETPGMEAFFRNMIALHEKAQGEINTILAGCGEAAGEDGSFMAVVHKTVIAVRSAVTGLDEDALSSFADGEARIVESYNTAIEDNAGEIAAVTTLKRQRSALLARIAEMKRKAA